MAVQCCLGKQGSGRNGHLCPSCGGLLRFLRRTEDVLTPKEAISRNQLTVWFQLVTVCSRAVKVEPMRLLGHCSIPASRPIKMSSAIVWEISCQEASTIGSDGLAFCREW